MIIFDYSPFANINNEYFRGLNETSSYKKVRLERAIFDEVHMIESVDVLCTQDKKDWDYDTVFLWKGDGIEAGNVGLSGLPINKLLIRRRRKDEYKFEDIKSFDFDPNIQFYEFKDRFIESHEDYIYGVQPMGGSVDNSVLGETTTGEVESKFDSVWIVGKDTQYQMIYNLEVGEYETIIPSNVTEVLGRQYPIISKSGNIKYRQGNIKCRLVSDESMNGGNIAPKAEKKIRRAIMAFLTDNKPKFFKDGSGESMLIAIINAPTLTPNNELNQLIYDINFDFVEVGDTEVQTLINNRLLEGV